MLLLRPQVRSETARVCPCSGCCRRWAILARRRRWRRPVGKAAARSRRQHRLCWRTRRACAGPSTRRGRPVHAPLWATRRDRAPPGAAGDRIGARSGRATAAELPEAPSAPEQGHQNTPSGNGPTPCALWRACCSSERRSGPPRRWCARCTRRWRCFARTRRRRRRGRRYGATQPVPPAAGRSIAAPGAQAENKLLESAAEMKRVFYGDVRGRVGPAIQGRVEVGAHPPPWPPPPPRTRSSPWLRRMRSSPSRSSRAA